MARMPGAVWRPIARNYTRRVTNKNCVILHTTASAAATSMHGWFSNPSAQSSSHFHVDFNGRIEQYVDTAYMSWANAAANSRSVTVETQGSGSESWTAAQVKAIVRIIQWARKAHPAIPLRQMNSSAASEKGIGWHRLGVNGNFGSGILRGRNQRGGGQVWSSAYGKVCPGTKRIKQIPSIIKQAGGSYTASKPTSGSIAKKNGIVYTNRRNAQIYKGTGKNAKLDPQQPVAQNYKLAKLGTKGKSGSWTVVSWKGRKRYIPTVQVSTKKTPVIMRTNRDKVEFFSHRGKTRKSLGYAHNKGYRIALIETAGSWSRVRWSGQNAWVPTAHIDHA